MANKQTLGFQTEVKQMLNLVIHSLYSNKEIFLRELVSNASDALDKLRFLSLSDASLYENDSNLKITIDYDDKNKTITIKDNGIGMSREEIIENLGTIAKSGTKEFLSKLEEGHKESHLIGQFGVGFYSAFIIADKVTVKSRRAGQPAEAGVVWQSSGEGEFTIEAENRSERGTEIILHVKKEEEEFVSDWRLRGIISKYSDHICWPIVMRKESSDTAEDDKDASTETTDVKANDKATETFETVNKATALWTLQKSEISDDEYKALYKHISHDYDEPLTWSHNHVEGKQEYISLLYVPTRAPFDMWQQEAKHGLKLYVKRVFILDEAAQFLPRYLRFIKGIIDANDLPLNVSREILQDNKQVEAIKSASTKRVLSMLDKMTSDADLYQRFWDEFGLVLKEGPIEDFANRDAIAKLLRFASTHSDSTKQTVSLADYIGRMKDKQDKIYFITASSYNAAKNSPHLEIFKKKGIEVLLLSDRVDEWLVGYLNEFEGKKLQSISKGKIDFDTDDNVEEKADAPDEANYSSLLEHIKKVLGEKVKDVVSTKRLTDSPACIVADDNDMGLEMQRILQAAGQKIPSAKPIFEVNLQHPLISRLNDINDDNEFADWSLVLFEQAVLAEGGQLEDPSNFIGRVNKLLLAV